MATTEELILIELQKMNDRFEKLYPTELIDETVVFRSEAKAKEVIKA